LHPQVELMSIAVEADADPGDRDADPGAGTLQRTGTVLTRAVRRASVAVVAGIAR
jgi:hypothetical protein